MMTEAAQFAKAFYGGDIPDSQMIVASQEVMRVVVPLKNDLRNKIGKSVTEDVMRSAILSALGYMNSIGVSNSTDYLKQPKLGIKVFNYALDAVREAIPRHEDTTNPADLSPIRERVLSAYNKWVEQANIEGVANPKLHAWKNLVDKVNSSTEAIGYAYYLLHWKIPVDEGFYGTEPYIAMCKADPSLPDRNPVRMEVNGKKWSGKLG